MAANFAQPKCAQPLPRLKKSIAEMSFHTKQKVFTRSRQTAIRKCQPKPISTLFNKILHISSPWGGGQAIRLPKRKHSNHRRNIQTKANFHSIQHNSSHFITIVSPYRCKAAPQRQNSKPN